ncbi:tRNA (adenosine(37)-N6)-threonylcarbamoyltransferase complex transferase subunit TsaD [Candidatus Dojkabacteria bacterium]|nr:tRNA (adenosine(37)-N6)-threonylcarbamoyltransferase complex transferase subunit TsaD [Candidatus Dojkabacteria bacterium]
MNILGIETSCDETSVAIVSNGKDVLSSVTNSQQAIHEKYGGVIPELGARKHIENIGVVYKEALDIARLGLNDIAAIAVTTSPGLSPALKTGIAFAMGLSQYGLPLIKVNHVIAHAYSLFLSQAYPNPDYPIITLIVSGGHTQLVRFDSPIEFEILGSTIDDAAGECFDKVARMLNLPYPGGPVIDKISSLGDEKAISFPRPMIESNNFDFSFSGLKTAVLYHIRDTKLTPSLEESNDPQKEISRLTTYDIAASFQEAVVDVLVDKTVRLAIKESVRNIGIAGGVSANSRLREKMIRRANEHNLDLFYPELNYCTDNAAMVAGLGYHMLKQD